MTYRLTAAGADLLAAYGFFIRTQDGVHDASDREWVQLVVPGDAGVLFAPPVQEKGRKLTLTGGLWTAANTIAAREAAEDALKDALRAGMLRLVRTSDSGLSRLIEGVAAGVQTKPVEHPLNGLGSAVTIAFLGRDAYWRDLEPLLRALPATGVRYPLPLGTAPSTPVIRLMAGTNPVLTYRDAGGAAVRSMTFTASLAATDYLDIDMRYRTITRVNSGAPVATSGLSLLTAGDFPWAFDPQDGDYLSATWPTLEVSSGSAEALWWRQWA
jgi:hypothetical protein